ncbi:MAG: hypothetical protein LC624_11560, partial [Halobacteriales archaeon]|nr:hypothetical protein [Halobacteriales archaeon]
MMGPQGFSQAPPPPPPGAPLEGGKVYVNGDLAGIHKNPRDLVDKLRARRRQGLLSTEVNVRFDEKTGDVYINCDAGRARRPLVVVRDGRPAVGEEHIRLVREGKLSWSDLIREGVVEYLDAEEEENTFIAIEPKATVHDHTHVEIDAMVILGIATSIIPY